MILTNATQNKYNFYMRMGFTSSQLQNSNLAQMNLDGRLGVLSMLVQGVFAYGRMPKPPSTTLYLHLVSSLGSCFHFHVVFLSSDVSPVLICKASRLVFA